MNVLPMKDDNLMIFTEQTIILQNQLKGIEAAIIKDSNFKIGSKYKVC
jgi:hypothetical protein